MNFYLPWLQKNFTVKIRSLYDYQLRLMQGVVPPPSGVDIANTIKYFSQTLLTVLKDVPNSPLELIKNPEMDGVRLGLFPSLDYKGLYNSLVPLIEVAPLIQYGIHAFGQAILQCLGSLLPFLEHDLIDNLPYLTASSIAVLPTNLHQDIVNTLCYYILPFTISRHKERENDICQSVSAVMMMVFQYSTNPAHHCQLLECLMTHKQNILKDILCVIAYGTSTARSSAAKLLFYYWPAFNPNLFDRKGLICKLGGDATPFVCQRDMCPNAGNAEAAKVCYDHCISITFASDTPPPLYLCIECANEIHREHPNQQFFDNLHPMQQVSMICENKNCRSTDKYAISICFSTECASYNGNRPIRYCEQCHNNRHNNKRGGDHMVHKCLPPTWAMDLEMQTYMVESIVSLLKEAKAPSNEYKETTAVNIVATGTSTPAVAGPGGSLSTNDSKNTTAPIHDNITIEDRQLLGRYGVWLLVGRCTPDEKTPIHIMGRLIAMLFHWFHTTAYSHDGQEESTLEKLKIENVCEWLRNIIKTHYKLFISCLLPHPPEYARVGGHWDALASRTSHLKDGLNRLFCLVPYEVITQDIWDYIMPHWMEAIVNDVPEKELIELKIILSKILDSDMSPLGFHAENMYHFVVTRFEKTTSKVQEQALHWLQTLTLLEITIPLQLLFSIFGNGVRNMKGEDDLEGKIAKSSKQGLISPVIEDCNSSGNTSLSDEENRFSQQVEFETDAEHNLFCCILMLDVLLKQMELQDIDKHTGLNSQLCKDVCWLLKCMLSSKLIHNHNCGSKSECGYCESSIMWHQLSLQLIKYLSPIYPAHPPDPPLEDLWEDSHSRKSPPDSEKKESKSEVPSMPIPDVHSVGGVLVHMPHVCSVRKVVTSDTLHIQNFDKYEIMTATVETVSEQLDLAAIIPAEKVVSAVARAITLSESDVGSATAQIAKPHIVGENDEPIESDTGDDIENFWQTSLGKFKFCVDDLPQPLQYIYQILKEIRTVEKPDVLYYMLQCLNVLILHGDACTKASKEHKGFFIWCQENLLIKNLWGLCDSDHSHICQEAVPILLHCITLPAGSDVFWRVIQDDFHSNDWCVRFTAVERVTVIARFMDSSPLRNILPLQAALANAFCYLISSIDDTNVYVAQRATLYLGTIHDSAIKSLIMCLETQFDSVIVDRPMVLQCLYQLHNSLSERKILTWEFFLNRFDTLFLEAQINLEKSGDISYLRDLRNTDMNSDIFIRKLHRAQEALSQSDGSGASSVKTLSASFGTKWPYKRTMSAPASIISRHDNKEYKEKVYNRQYSAPILKRKSSRFGLGQFLATNYSIPDGHMHSLNLVDDQNLLNFLQRVIDLEEADKETMHLLVFLLMQFLSRSDQAYPSDEKNIAKTQGIVLRHLYLLLGYSQNDKGLYLTPTRLRTSPAFSAFLSNLPQILDQNHLMGRILLPTCLILLLYSPSPYHIPNNVEFQQPTYSLWAMEPHFRKNWLMSLVVLLYKYQYNQHPQCLQLTSLVRVVLNTLDSQHHHCRRIPATIIMGGPPSRSRDVSQPSLGTENDHAERQITTPPLSPMYSSDGQSVQVSISSKCGKAQVIYTKPSSTTSMETHWEEVIQCAQPEKIGHSIDGDDTESELIPIPESDMSDSTLHGSTQDLFEDGSEEITVINNAQQRNQIIPKTFKEGYISHMLRKSSSKRPTWFIGSEEEFLKSCELKKNLFHDDNKKTSPDTTKNCSKITVSSQVAILPVVAGRTSVTEKTPTEKRPPITIGKHKKVIEPSITPVCTPTSDCDDCFKSNQLLLTPSVERLLPIGASRGTETPKEAIFTATRESHFEIPCQERLLPIGQHNKDISQFVDKVKQALGLNMQIQKVDAPKTTEQFKKDNHHQSSSYSPRKLIKQVALESPPNQGDYDNNIIYKGLKTENQKDMTLNHKQRMRKAGPFTMGPFVIRDPRKPGAWFSPLLSPKLDRTEMKQSSFRIGDECVNERCSECGTIKEEYSDEELGLCIVVLGTFIHREPALAAPMLPDILSIVSKVATNAFYPWQSENNIHLPGGAVSVAHQFLRCVLHQLAPNGIFTQMFQTNASENIRVQFFKSVIQALLDFNELNPIAPLQLLLETLNSKKTLSCDTLPTVLENMACYLECLPMETTSGPTSTTWGTVLQQLEILYRRIAFMLNAMDDMAVLLKIIISIFKVPTISQHKGLLEPLSKVISYTIQTHVLNYNYLVEICYLCNRSFARERDKLMLNRLVVYELVQAMKFKISIPDSNLLMLINIVLQDVGGSIPQNIVVIKDCRSAFSFDYAPGYTNISDCMRLHLNDILEFLTDFHTLAKIKSYCKGVSVGLNEDTIGGIIKCAMAQYLALEITRSNGRDNRAVNRYFPWLYNTISNQQSPKEFVECINHVRLLSWLLLGSLTHTAMIGSGPIQMSSQPIPHEASCQIADHIQIIMAGFSEQPKASVLHMSSLFHTFILCQLWTIYLEQSLTGHNPLTEAYNVIMNVLFDFWGKVTPCILQLIQQSKILSEIVSLHFLSMLEALIECHCTFVGKLLPLWTPVLCSNQIQSSGQFQMRLQFCRNTPPLVIGIDPMSSSTSFEKKRDIHNPTLLKWLQRLQFKMGQIELQSSTATQFYSL